LLCPIKVEATLKMLKKDLCRSTMEEANVLDEEAAEK